MGATKKIPRKKLIHGLGEIQNLIGMAQSAYQQDVGDACRAAGVMDPLKRAFTLCVELRSTDPSE